MAAQAQDNDQVAARLQRWRAGEQRAPSAQIFSNARHDPGACHDVYRHVDSSTLVLPSLFFQYAGLSGSGGLRL